MHAAVKLKVTIRKDRVVKLPEDLPEGRAEIIVLYPEPAPIDERAPARPASKQTKRPSYYKRLTSRQPDPLSAAASRALDEADRADR